MWATKTSVPSPKPWVKEKCNEQKPPYVTLTRNRYMLEVDLVPPILLKENQNSKRGGSGVKLLQILCFAGLLISVIGFAMLVLGTKPNDVSTLILAYGTVIWMILLFTADAIFSRREFRR